MGMKAVHKGTDASLVGAVTQPRSELSSSRQAAELSQGSHAPSVTTTCLPECESDNTHRAAGLSLVMASLRFCPGCIHTNGKQGPIPAQQRILHSSDNVLISCPPDRLSCITLVSSVAPHAS